MSSHKGKALEGVKTRGVRKMSDKESKAYLQKRNDYYSNKPTKKSVTNNSFRTQEAIKKYYEGVSNKH